MWPSTEVGTAVAATPCTPPRGSNTTTVVCVSPFPGRRPTLCFRPRDRSRRDDVQAADGAPVVVEEEEPPWPGAAADPTSAAAGERKALPVVAAPEAARDPNGRRRATALCAAPPPAEALYETQLQFVFGKDAVRFTAVMATLHQAGMREVSPVFEPNWSLKWVKHALPSDYKSLKGYQKLNHFPNSRLLTRKDLLHQSLAAQRVRCGAAALGDFVPDGWLLPQDTDRLLADMTSPSDGGHRVNASGRVARNVYICKRAAGAAGKDMHLIFGPPLGQPALARDADACHDPSPQAHEPPPPGEWLVQRYIRDPLLIHGRKFDLRVYVVVTSFHPLRVYRYNEGLVRFAATPYPAPATHEGPVDDAVLFGGAITAHLTNFTVNKSVPAADAAAGAVGGAKWTFQQLRSYFDAHSVDSAGTFACIDDLVIKTLLAAEPSIVEATEELLPPAMHTCGVNVLFQLYGFDVLLRDAREPGRASVLQPVLMEVNAMPSLSTHYSPLDQQVKANLIADMLTLVGIHPGPAPTRRPVKGGPHGDADPRAGVADHPFLVALDQQGTSTRYGICSADARTVCYREEEEALRQGHFTRLFPSAASMAHYAHLFAAPRPLNALLCDWERAKTLGVAPIEDPGR